MADELDWSSTGDAWAPLGEGFWREAQTTARASEEQLKFAVCKFRGMTSSGAARAAGYAGNRVTLRQAGSRAAKSTAVMTLMSLAAAEQGAGPDGTVDGSEAKRILSKLARGSDPSVRIRALEALAKINEADNGPHENYEVWRPDRFIAEWLQVFPMPLAPLVAGLMALFPGKIAKAVSHFNVEPLVNDLAPWIAQLYPDVWAIVRTAFKDRGEQEWMDQLEKRPLRPIVEIIAMVENHGDVRKVERNFPDVLLLSGEQVKAYVRGVQAKRNGDANQTAE